MSKDKPVRKNIPHLDSFNTSEQIKIITDVLRGDADVYHKYDGARLNLRFTENGTLQIRTARSGWIEERGVFEKFAQENGRDLIRARQYDELLGTLFKGLTTVSQKDLKSQEQFLGLEFHCEFFFKPMCRKIDIDMAADQYVQNKAPFVFRPGCELELVVFAVEGDHELIDAAVWLQGLFSFGGVLEPLVRVEPATYGAAFVDVRDALVDLVVHGKADAALQMIVENITKPKVHGVEGIVIRNKSSGKMCKIILDEYRVRKT